KDMPAIFASENSKNVPAAALWMTNILVQLFIISTYWSSDAFALMLSLTSSMSLIPYLLVAAFGVMLARRGDVYAGDEASRKRDLTTATIATLYTAFMIYAGGFKFLLLSALLYAPGTVLYLWACREQARRPFTRIECGIFLLAVAGAVAAVVALFRGYIQI